MTPDPRTILLVEDNEDDVFIFRRVYRQALLTHTLHVVTDGQQALDFLRGEGAFADRTQHPLPFLVLLDLKLPLKHGFEVLQALRTDAELSALCTIVLTSSAEARDIRRAHQLGAQAFLVKPPSRAALVATVAVAGARTGPEEKTRIRIPGDMFEVALPLAPGSMDAAGLT